MCTGVRGGLLMLEFWRSNRGMLAILCPATIHQLRIHAPSSQQSPIHPSAYIGMETIFRTGTQEGGRRTTTTRHCHSRITAPCSLGPDSGCKYFKTSDPQLQSLHVCCAVRGQLTSSSVPRLSIAVLALRTSPAVLCFCVHQVLRTVHS